MMLVHALNASILLAKDNMSLNEIGTATEAVKYTIRGELRNKPLPWNTDQRPQPALQKWTSVHSSHSTGVLSISF